MARYRAYDYAQTQLVAVSLEEQLEPGTLEHTIHYVVQQRLKLAEFDRQRVNDETGAPGYDPRILLKAVLLGYARGLLSSRKLEAACRSHIMFMALTCGQTPDHSTIAEFVSGMGEERIASLFGQVLLVCEQEGLLGGTHFALDGYKLSSNAAKEWSGTHEDLRKKHAKLQELVRERVREHRRNDARKSRKARQQEGTRIARLRRQAERIEAFLEASEPRIGRMGQEVQSNITDNESAKMKSSHGILQGYNANAMVDAQHQVIVHAQAFGEGDDGAVAEPMLQGATANLRAAGRGAAALADAVVSADTSYFTTRNLEAFAAAKVDAYVPDQQFRQRDIRFADARRHRRPTDKRKQQYKSKRRWFGPEDFKYDPKTERLICPAGVKLHRTGRNVLHGGHRVDSYRAAKSACLKCPLRLRCLQKPQSGNPRQVRVFHDRVTETLTSQMKDKIDMPKGRAIYSQRLGIVEPVFGHIAGHKRMNRSTLRGKTKVNIQWKLYCMVHNLEKVARYGRKNN